MMGVLIKRRNLDTHTYGKHHVKMKAKTGGSCRDSGSGRGLWDTGTRKGREGVFTLSPTPYRAASLGNNVSMWIGPFT